MIVINEQADSKLIKTLESLRTNQHLARYIYFKLSGRKDTSLTVYDIIKRTVISSEQQSFFCADGDVFILLPLMQTQAAMLLITAVCDHLGKTLNEEFVEYNELRLHINRLLIIMDAKLEKQRQLHAAQEKEHQQKLSERHRQEILSIFGQSELIEKIATKRQTRKEPEIMVIEDDAFSRRLVDNALKSDYHVTGLGEVDYALSTYIALAPDVLFLDINLPDVSGHDLLKKIMEIDPAAYVVMLSGNCDRSSIMQAMTNGAKGFVAKPFTCEKLLQYIDRCPTIHQ